MVYYEAFSKFNIIKLLEKLKFLSISCVFSKY